MTRTVSAATTDDTGTSIHLVRINYWDGAAQQEVRLTDAPMDVSVTVGAVPETWVGAGILMSVANVTEGSDFDVSGLDIMFDGVNQTVIAIIMNNHFRNQPIEIWKAWFDNASGAVVGSPMLLFKGHQNEAYTIGESSTDAPDAVSVSTRAISLLSRVNSENVVLTNPVSHLNMLIRGGLSDTTANFWAIVPTIVGIDIYWGQATPTNKAPTTYTNTLEEYNRGAFD
jgi:hypothetical protein